MGDKTFVSLGVAELPPGHRATREYTVVVGEAEPYQINGNGGWWRASARVRERHIEPRGEPRTAVASTPLDARARAAAVAAKRLYDLLGEDIASHQLDLSSIPQVRITIVFEQEPHRA